MTSSVAGRCYRAATTWLPPERVDVTTLVAVLASALGVHEPANTDEVLERSRFVADEGRDSDDTAPVTPPDWPEYAWHAPLLVADLLPFAPARLSGYLETTFAECTREAREELP